MRISWSLMRTLFSSAMVALAVAAMLWGNCLSCPDMLAAMASHQPDHSCCHKPHPAPVACHAQVMQHFVKAETHTVATPAVAELAELPASVAPPATLAAALTPVQHAPPGNLTLLTTLRI
jgi:hypothetical protein